MSKIGQLVSDTLTTITANDLSGITMLRSGSFIGRKALTSVTLPSGITSIRDDAFDGCTNLSTAILPNTLTSIWQYSFANCPNLAIVIPSSVTSIGKNAYKESCLTIPNYELFIPKSVSSIGNGCFIAQLNIAGQTNFNITSIIFEAGSTLTTIPINCFQYQGALTTLTLPSSLTKIDAYAFSDCTALPSITIPSSVTNIGNMAFQNTNSITEIRFLTPAGASISLPTAGSSNGMFYRKTAKSGVTVYTDNATVKNYGWSSDNLTCSFKHLDGTDWT